MDSRRLRALRRCTGLAMRAGLLLFLLALLSAAAPAERGAGPRYALSADGARTRSLLNGGWLYLERNARDPGELERFSDEWRPVDLPHSWNAFDATDALPGYRRDAGWYRRRIEVGDTAGARYILRFEGASITTDVYVNGVRAGGHVGGYVGFDVDLTPQLRPGAANTLDVRVDNAYDPRVVPSQKADFTIFGGITRDVWLEVRPAAHVRALRVRTPEVRRDAARAVLVLDLARPASPAGYVVEAVLSAPDGRVVARVSRPLERLGAGDAVEVALPPVERPALWSPDSPALYTATARLLRDGRVADALSDRFGFRWFEFRPGGPFLLNGERLLLRGTHWHEDYAGLGAALPDSLRRSDMEAIRAMGANFVRLAHYPHDPEVYRAADELGLLVWDELPWCRGGVGDAEWQSTTRRLLEEQILQNFNHPSIILWSLGNEVDWLPDFPGGGEPERVDAFLHELNDLAHRLDPSRMTALRKYPGAVGIVDVFSPSIWAGWYNGVYGDYRKALESTRRTAPRFLHMEFGGDSHIGRHTATPVSGEGLVRAGAWEESAVQTRVDNVAQNGDWSESYIVDLFDWYLTVSEGLDWLAGTAQWAFKDFATPLRPENPIPYVNQKGLVDRAGVPKDAYWLFRSRWTTAPRFARIESHSWTEREGPAGEPTTVRVWSNCDAVELLLDGAGQGVRRRDPEDFPAQGLRWSVVLRDGENRLAARCAPSDGPAAGDSLTVRYSTAPAGAPHHIRLSSRPLDDGNLLIEAVVVDARGRRALDYEKRIYFSHDGAGRLLVDYGTPTRSGVIEAANGRAAIEFVPEPGGRAVIEARNQDFKGDYLVIEPPTLEARARAVLDTAAARYARVAASLDPAAGHPRSTGPDGRWRTVRVNDWTSGFFPGTLWYLYEHTGDPALREQAERWTLPLARIPEGRYSHDLGFQFRSSFGNAYRITGEARFREPALDAARRLAARFDPDVGAIRSWDWKPPRPPFPVIVDNMMNLELLFWGARQGGDAAWAELARRHARTTRANHVRGDGGSFHVVVFDTATGAVQQRITHQGHADSTTWARGQAWLIYGFTMAYRETGEADLLETARRVADYALERLPADRVPCWDYQAPGCPETAERDASAAAIAASGLLELSRYAPAGEGARYRRAAEEMLAALVSPAYLARGPEASALLMHAVGHHPRGIEVDVGLVYADYYLVEALLRYLELRKVAAGA